MLSRLALTCICASLLTAVTACGPLLADEDPVKTTIHFRFLQPADGDLSPDQFEAARKKALLGVVRRLQRQLQFKQFEVRLKGKDRLEIEIPTTEQQVIDRVSRMLMQPGTIEFALVANRHDHGELIERAKDVDEVADQDRLQAYWAPVARDQQGELRVPLDDTIVHRSRETERGTVVELLLVVSAERLTGKYLEQVQAVRENIAVGPSGDGRHGIEIRWNEKGGQISLKLTGDNLPEGDLVRKLAIVIDGRILMAPSIQGKIGDRAHISGDFSREEVNELVGRLQVGPLPLPLEPIKDAP